MAARFPLVLDETNSQLRELPVGDDLDLTGNNLTGLATLSTTGGITAGGTINAALLTATNATVSGNVEALTYTVGGANLLKSIDFADVQNAPTIPTDVNQLADVDELLGGGFSGDYNDLTNLPSIPTDIQDLTDNSSLIPDDINDLTDVDGLLSSGGSFQTLSDTFQFATQANKLVVVSADEQSLAPITVQSVLDNISSAQITGALGFTPYNDSNPDGYINNSQGVIQALGFTPYDAANPTGYISTVTEADVTTALGFAPYDGTANSAGFINDSAGIINAIGYTPYDGATNSLGFLTAEADNLDKVVERNDTTTRSINTGAVTSTGALTGTSLITTTAGINFNHSNAVTIDSSGGNTITIGSTSGAGVILDGPAFVQINKELRPSGTVGLGNASNQFASGYIQDLTLNTISSTNTALSLATTGANSVLTLDAQAGVRIGPNADYVELPSGTTATRPGSPNVGTFMYNSDAGRYFEIYDPNRFFVNSGGTGYNQGGWMQVFVPYGGTPGLTDTYRGMLAVADGTSWDPTGVGDEALMCFLNDAWVTVAT